MQGSNGWSILIRLQEIKVHETLHGLWKWAQHHLLPGLHSGQRSVHAHLPCVILASERTGRCARVIEIDPHYVDVSIRRWQRHTGGEAVHAVTGETFNQRARSLDNGAT